VLPAAAIAVSAGRVAAVHADLGWGHALRAQSDAPVEIRDVRTGRLALRVHPHGEVRAVALSTAVLTVLVRDGRALRLEIYNARTGTRQSSVRVGSKAGVYPELAASGTTVVYSDQHTIRTLRAGQRATSLVANVSAEYFGELSIEGRRVVWDEFLDGGREGRIQTIELR
jgi:hypothetical protein